jgi:enoyl-CoA hydratase/carnithine racemase
MELNVSRYSVDDVGVATVWMDRPGRGNSWTSRMNVEYRWIMARLDGDPDVRAVVVTGTGRQFCVGADRKALDFYVDDDGDYSESVKVEGMENPGYGIRPEFDHDLVWQWGLRLPVIAAINGACAGIAMALVSFCDLRFAAAGAKFTTAAAKLGLPAEYGLAWILPRIVGLTHAADILVTGRVVLAEELHSMGFLNGVLPAEEVLPHAQAVARTIATDVSPASATVAKRQLYAEVMRGDVGAAIEDSKRLIGEMMSEPDYKEGVQAFIEGRPPRFR